MAKQIHLSARKGHSSNSTPRNLFKPAWLNHLTPQSVAQYLLCISWVLRIKFYQEKIMGNLLLTKYATYVTVSTVLFLLCPDMRSSEVITEGITSEELSLQQEYDPDSMHAYYDSGI